MSIRICRICSTEHYPQSYYEPEEPCICGHGVKGESPWQYAGFRGVLAWFKYSVLTKWFDRITGKWANWLYKEWDF